MNIYVLDRDTVIKRIVQNMVEAGVVKPCEHEIFTNELQKLDPKDLLAVLVESHTIREQQPKCMNFYPVDAGAFSPN